MDSNEANKIIAEFMGYYYIGIENKRLEDLPCLILTRKCDGERIYKYPYSESLDALVPVWQKLKEDFDLYHFDIGFNGNEFSVDITFENKAEALDDTIMRSNCAWSNTIQEAAAIATAKAIKELATEVRSTEGAGE